MISTTVYSICLLLSCGINAGLTPQSCPTVELLSESHTDIVISFRTPEIKISEVSFDGQIFSEITLQDEFYFGREGMPDLPAITRNVIVPANAGIEIDILKDVSVEIDASAPPRICTFDVGGDNPDPGMSQAVRSEIKKGVYPSEFVSLGHPRSFRGIRLVPITVYPYQYDSDNQNYIYHEDVEVAIRLTPGNDDKNDSGGDNQLAKLTRDSYRFLRALALNPPHRDDNGATLPRGGYLIIVGSFYSQNQQEEMDEIVGRLADWKRACGHQVEVVWRENQANTILRDHIRPAYEEWDHPLEHLCLIGDWGTPAAPASQADVTFGFLEGGNNDHISEISVGRLSSGSVTQTEIVIGRALGYQAEPLTEEMDWFDRAGAVSENVRGWTPSVNYTVKWIAEGERRAGFGDVWSWINQEDNGDPGGQISNWMRDKVNVIFQRGDTYGTQFTRDNFPVYIAAGGGHGENLWNIIWDYGSRNNLNGPSVISGTRHRQGTLPCNVLVGGMARGLLVDKMSVGWARAFAIAMLDYGDVLDVSFDYYAREFGMYGEPGQTLWLGQPREIEVDYPVTIPLGANIIEVEVYDANSEEAVPNALVTITQPGELLCWDFSDEDGNCTHQFDPDIEGPLILTVTGDQLLPFRAEIDIEQAQVYVGAMISEIDDEQGNGDETINPGESVQLSITACNLGDGQVARDVTGVIGSDSPWATIEERVIEFGDIDPEEESEGNETVELTVSSNAPEGADLRLYIELDFNDESSKCSLPVELVGARLCLVDVLADEVIQENMSPVDIRLENVGSLASQQIAVQLVSNHWTIQVVEDLSFIGSIEPDQSDDLLGRPFRINPSSIAIPGTRVEMLLLLFADEEGVPDTLSFELVVGVPSERTPQGPDEYGYVCFDDTDVDWEPAPEFDWIEISPQENDRDFDGESLPGGRGQNFAVEIPLPFEFVYYGQPFELITVCENGFIAVGEGLDELCQYENFPLDRSMSGSFSMIAPFWDELRVNNDADIYTYHDEDSHIFIIEWYGLNNDGFCFEIILYNPENYPLDTGDGMILFQYIDPPQRGNNRPPNHYSVGISSPDGTMGINYVSDNDYPITSAPIEDRRAILFTTAHQFVTGNLTGIVTDAQTGAPIEGAIVYTNYGQVAVADEDGVWFIPEAWASEFSITSYKLGYNDSTLTDLMVEEGDTLEIDFDLLHPEFTPSDWELSAMLDPGVETEIGFTLFNTGNGPLDWKLERCLIGDANQPPWNYRRSFEVGFEVDDDHLEGVAFIDQHFYVTGGNSRNPTIYKINREGALVDTFPQFNQDNLRGLRDLAWDGDLIWGAIEWTIYGFSTEGELVRSFDGPFRPITCIAYDPDRDLLWISSTTTDILAITREGEYIDSLDIPRQNLRIYGLGYYEDDVDNHQLYVYNRERETNRNTVHKINPDIGDTVFVAYLDLEMDASPSGVFITNTYDVYSWVFMTIGAASREDGDRVDLWQVEGRKDWFQVDIDAEDGRVEADSGRIESGDRSDFFLVLNSSLLPDTLFEAELLFHHNADSGRGHIYVDLEVIGPMPPFPFSLALPADGDTLDTTSVVFTWDVSIDPNFGEDVSYYMQISSDQDTFGIETADTTITLDIDALFGLDVEESATFTWWVKSISGQDTVDCETPFSFRFIPDMIGNPEDNIPLEYGLHSIYPNPFNSLATITFGIQKEEYTSLAVYDVSGREVVRLYEDVPKIGYHRVEWDASTLSSGIYLLRLRSASGARTAKITLVK